MAMNHTPGVLEFLFAAIMWAVMMIVMMLPAASPVFLLFARTSATKDATSSRFVSAAFVSGYFTIWIGFSLAAAALQIVLQRASLFSPAMAVSHRALAGAILIGAGIFQFTPLKHACLTSCRSPLNALMTYWRNGSGGAYLMGLRHGAYCVGCCWAEMLVLFVVGVMNILWIALLAVLVILEKMSSRGPLVARLGGVTMILAGITFLVPR